MGLREKATEAAVPLIGKASMAGLPETSRNRHGRMGLEGVVSKRADALYRSRSWKTWVKAKNPASNAVRREREEE